MKTAQLENECAKLKACSSRNTGWCGSRGAARPPGKLRCQGSRSDKRIQLARELEKEYQTKLKNKIMILLCHYSSLQRSFLTKGLGRHKEKLASFEEALRDAKIAKYNLVHVSSIFPPHCKVIPAKKGIEKLKDGQIVHCVLSRNAINENHRLIASSVGLAVPKDNAHYGYISEHHTFGETDEKTGDYAEDLAALMLSTIQGIEFGGETTWDQKEEIWKLSGKIVKSTNVTQSAIGSEGLWTTVIAAAVFILKEYRRQFEAHCPERSRRAASRGPARVSLFAFLGRLRSQRLTCPSTNTAGNPLQLLR